MKKLLEKISMAFIRAKLAKDEIISEERGDTNFISIAIILIVVIVIAILFITFGQDLAAKLGSKIKELMDKL